MRWSRRSISWTSFSSPCARARVSNGDGDLAVGRRIISVHAGRVDRAEPRTHGGAAPRLPPRRSGGLGRTGTVRPRVRRPRRPWASRPPGTRRTRTVVSPSFSRRTPRRPPHPRAGSRPRRAPPAPARHSHRDAAAAGGSVPGGAGAGRGVGRVVGRALGAALGTPLGTATRPPRPPRARTARPPTRSASARAGRRAPDAARRPAPATGATGPTRTSARCRSSSSSCASRMACSDWTEISAAVGSSRPSSDSASSSS
jgi:hypothetical protein